ncbi:hypothetical protein [Mucilaginibacter sp. CSA2-8R]|uniref:hypothetical protein n=1 Tax=Mucilaginibacter sp. CSA2-8R TaxID=3141542 RepID=UPI00315C8C16
MLDEHEFDRIIALGFILGVVLIIIGTVNVIYALIKQLSKNKAVYKCHLCKKEF